MMKEFCFLMSVTGLSRPNVGNDDDACSINCHPELNFSSFQGSQHVNAVITYYIYISISFKNKINFQFI
jgi:hypothetical protein